ncbi:metalloprotease, partial [Paenibacillus polymyxa]
MGLQLAWNNEQNDMVINESLITLLNTLLEEAGRVEGVTDGEVALTFVNDEQIHELNRDYRG